MNKLILKTVKLFMGLFLVSLGGVFMLNANIGMVPWDVLHSGVSKSLGITIGQAIIIINIAMTMIGVMLKEKIGIGTICNIIFIGVFVDLIKNMNIVPMNEKFITGFIMLNIGIIIMAIGTVIYISCELGCGAKDSVTMGLTRLLKKPVKLVRSSLELVAIVIGMSLGGVFSMITIYAAIVFGYFMQAAFKILKCNAQELNHLSIMDIFKKEEVIEQSDINYETAV